MILQSNPMGSFGCFGILFIKLCEIRVSVMTIQLSSDEWIRNVEQLSSRSVSWLTNLLCTVSLVWPFIDRCSGSMISSAVSISPLKNFVEFHLRLHYGIEQLFQNSFLDNLVRKCSFLLSTLSRKQHFDSAESPWRRIYLSFRFMTSQFSTSLTRFENMWSTYF